jgi:hypothetical protein
MQTFITDHDMAISASNLDNKRLGKQRVEALQIFSDLTIRKTRWHNHPAVKMWKGYEGFLLYVYLREVLFDWEIRRGFNNTLCNKKWRAYCRIRFYGNATCYDTTKPPWITDKFIESHRSNLIRKDRNLYKPIFPNTEEGLDYIWPV